MNPRAMVLGGPRDDRSSRQVITFSLERRPGLGHTAPVSRREKGPTMLSATLGMLAMLPVVFGVAGWAMVSR
jgi:hypothetical protein